LLPIDFVSTFCSEKTWHIIDEIMTLRWENESQGYLKSGAVEVLQSHHLSKISAERRKI
jgi:hypothetical protein